LVRDDDGPFGITFTVSIESLDPLVPSPVEGELDMSQSMLWTNWVKRGHPVLWLVRNRHHPLHKNATGNKRSSADSVYDAVFAAIAGNAFLCIGDKHSPFELFEFANAVLEVMTVHCFGEVKLPHWP
jgi:hypothetical protein